MTAKQRKEFARMLGARGGKKRAKNSSPEQLSAWAALGAQKREENKKRTKEKAVDNLPLTP